MSWIVTNWRLKALALVLTLALLGALAFSENPLEVQNVSAKVQYNLPSGNKLVLTQYQLTITVPVVGLRDAVERYRATAAGVALDLQNAHPGANQTFSARPADVPSGVTLRSASVPITVSIEAAQTADLDIEVQTPKVSPGIQVQTRSALCGNDQGSCKVSVTSAASDLSDLSAHVLYDAEISTAATIETPSQRVLFEQRGRPVDLSKLNRLPAPTWTPSRVTVRIETQGGTETKTVPVNPNITGTQACGFVISRVDYLPSQLVTLQGPADVVAKLNEVSTDPIDISGLNASRTYTVGLRAGGQVNITPKIAKITLNVNRAFNCTAPSPPPGTGPSPSPAASASPGG